MSDLIVGMLGALLGGALSLVGGSVEARRQRRLRARDDQIAVYLDYLRWHDRVMQEGSEIQQIPSDVSARMSAFGSTDIQSAITTDMYLWLLVRGGEGLDTPSRKALISSKVSLLHFVLARAVEAEVHSLRPQRRSPRALIGRWRAERKIKDLLMGEEPSLDIPRRVREIREAAEQAMKDGG